MSHLKTRNYVILSALLGFAILIAGCGDKSEPEAYSIPKEESPSQPPMVQQEAPATPQMPPADGMSSMAGQSLPDSALNQAQGNPGWVVPADWSEKPASSMRRGSFAADGSAGPLDISVTSFPGDVGGLLANINRWRGQVGLGPIGSAELEAAVERRTINGKEAILTRIEAPTNGMYVGIFEHQGNSWFFRMAGPVASINEQTPAFLEFVSSVDFEN